MDQTIDAGVMVIGAAVGSAFGYFFGQTTEAIAWLFWIIVIDFVLGTARAVKNGRWTSNRCAQGFIKKFAILAVCALSHGLDVCAGTTFLQFGFISAFAFSEFGSILEKLSALGLAGMLPDNLKAILQAGKDRQVPPFGGRR